MNKTITTASAINQGLTAQHIATNLANYEAARSSFFVLEISGLSNLLQTNYQGGIDTAGNNAANFMDGKKAQEALRLNCTTTFVPDYSVGVLQYKRGNDIVKFAGGPEYKTGNITIDDVVGLDTKSILYAWKRLAYDSRTFKGGRMADYKKTATLIEYTQDYAPIRFWTIYGCWINDINEADFDRNSDEMRRITASLIYDRSEMRLPEDEAI